MKRWEYKTLTVDYLPHESELNGEGDYGWELVTVVRTAGRAYKGDGVSTGWECIFKREVVPDLRAGRMLIQGVPQNER